ncbi:MAG: dihydrolipoyl dehydrogenase [Polyangia bacterium]
MSEARRHDLVVIGAGPGGYVAAIRAAQLGMDVACIERGEAPGGTCLNLGCIPSKALLESSELYHRTAAGLGEHGIVSGEVRLDLGAMMKRKDRIVRNLTKGVAFLLKKNGVTRYGGVGGVLGPGRVAVEGDEPVEIVCEHVLVATGSKPSELPGVELDFDRIGTSTTALSYPEVPERLIVIGAGYIGLELGSVWSRLGSRVTVVEYMDRILPGIDEEIATQAHRALKKQGLRFELGARVTGARVEGEECAVEIEGRETPRAERVLLAAGRSPSVDGLGCERAGIELTAAGRIRVDGSWRTSLEGVFAIGDVIGGAMLAHKASDEGIACVERIAGLEGEVRYDAIPSVVYTSPEIAAVGRTERQLVEDGISARKGVFPFRANGRAMSLGETTGIVKVLACAETDRLLGVHIIGPRAGDLIAEAAAAIARDATSRDLAATCHAHPTLSEALGEAALAVDGRPIHA